MGLGVEVGIVAVEPVDAAMRFQVGCLQHAPDRGATHGFFGVLVDQLGGQIVQAPLAGHTVVLSGGAGRQRDDCQLFVGGKSSVAVLAAEHLEDRRDRVACSEFARAPRCCERKPTRWRPVNWMADRRPRCVKSGGNGRPTLEEWNGLASEPVTADDIRRPEQPAEQRGEASWHPCPGENNPKATLPA